MSRPLLLGVNIDHVATLRQARGTQYPEVLHAGLIAQQAGADSITIHLREDRRHIQPQDVIDLKQQLHIPLNLEMAVEDNIIAFALDLRPAYCCLVPEKREELTTEGGLSVVGQEKKITNVCQQLADHNIQASLFIDPDKQQIEAAKQCGAPVIELHTGCYADAAPQEQAYELTRIKEAADFAHQIGLRVHAGHGLHYHNVQPIVAIDVIKELNIGHSIISRAVFTGLNQAIIDMKELIK